MTTKGYKVPFGVMKIFWNQIVAMVAQLCEYTKRHGLDSLRTSWLVNCISVFKKPVERTETFDGW